MSETPNTTPVLAGHEFDAELQEHYIQKDGYRLYRKAFTGDLAGVQFYVLQFDGASNDDEATVSLEKIKARFGAASIVDLVNTQLATGTRARVKNSKIPKYEDSNAQAEALARLVAQDPVLFSAEDAENYKPGSREPSVAGIANAIKKAMKEGRRAEAEALSKQLVAAIVREQQLQAALEN
jgi:predicted RNA-binding protein with TRAM domain